MKTLSNFENGRDVTANLMISRTETIVKICWKILVRPQKGALETLACILETRFDTSILEVDKV